MIGDKSKERQDFLQWHFDNEYFLESQFDFSDCEDGQEAIDAVCKMIADNFDEAHDGSRIKELIQMACYAYAAIEWRDYAQYESDSNGGE